MPVNDYPGHRPDFDNAERYDGANPGADGERLPPAVLADVSRMTADAPTVDIQVAPIERVVRRQALFEALLPPILQAPQTPLAAAA